MTLMTPVNVLLGATYIACRAVSVEAAPLCPELLIAEALEPKYQRLAPIYSDTDSGWIFTTDQLSETYELKSEATHLMTQIAAEFAQRDVTLALMIAPPRPLVAGHDTLFTTLGGQGVFDTAAATTSFTAMLDQLRQTGAIVPNLLDVALQSDEAALFYFQRDTHWTPSGAAQSALAMADQLGAADDAYDIAQVTSALIYEEKGSLNAIGKAVCDVDYPPEPAALMDFSSTTSTQALGLLDDVSGPSIALVGTSFSDRNQRDQYQVADALAAATGHEVFNYSVSGGGMIGPMEAFVASGELDTAGHQTVIWEFPYTQSPNATSQLRQLLGALRAQRSETVAIASLEVPTSGTATLDISGAPLTTDFLAIATGASELLKLDVELTFENGKTKTVKLRRKNRIPLDRRPSDWWVDLSGWSNGGIVQVSLKLDQERLSGPVLLSHLPSTTDS